MTVIRRELPGGGFEVRGICDPGEHGRSASWAHLYDCRGELWLLTDGFFEWPEHEHVQLQFVDLGDLAE